jgi:hypothetical protein
MTRLTEALREELNEEWSRIGNAYVVEDFRLTRQSSGLALVLAFVLRAWGCEIRQHGVCRSWSLTRFIRRKTRTTASLGRPLLRIVCELRH